MLKTTTYLIVLTALLASAISTSVEAQEQSLKFAHEKVADGIYMIYGSEGFTGGNIGISVGADGVAVIDNGVPNALDALRAEIAKITDQPIDYLINTHVHGDHIGNNAAFGADGARLISHRNLRDILVTKGVGRGDEFVAPPADALPVITFNEEMTINLNDDALRVIHLPDAHTSGDAVIFFMQNNIIHTGDIMFNTLFPFIDSNNGGTLDGTIAAMIAIQNMGDANTKIMPGHGPLASKADVQSTIDMLTGAKQLVSDMVADGKTNEEILAANPLQKYESFSWQFITTERMTNQVIKAVRGEE